MKAHGSTLHMFDKYRYLKFPMGLMQLPAWAHVALKTMFEDILHEIECYNDVDIFSDSWEDPIKMIDVVLGMTPRKWIYHGETQKLRVGHYIIQLARTLDDACWHQTVQANPCTMSPKDHEELCKFVGMVHFYCMKWHKQARIITCHSWHYSKTQT
jgi:hypothetical protein